MQAVTAADDSDRMRKVFESKASGVSTSLILVVFVIAVVAVVDVVVGLIVVVVVVVASGVIV